jgi:hypothetical protein
VELGNVPTTFTDKVQTFMLREKELSIVPVFGGKSDPMNTVGVAHEGAFTPDL